MTAISILERKLYVIVSSNESKEDGNLSKNPPKGGFPVMAEITRILAVNICRQFFFVTASTRCLVQNFQLICYSQRGNATSQYNDSGSSRCSKWPNDRIVAVVKHCRLLVQEKKRLQIKMTKDCHWIVVQENIGMFSKS